MLGPVAARLCVLPPNVPVLLLAPPGAAGYETAASDWCADNKQLFYGYAAGNGHDIFFHAVCHVALFESPLSTA